MKNTAPCPLCHEADIASQPVFAFCNSDAREILVAASQCIIHAKGEYLFKENENVTGLFCLNSGLVKVVREGGHHPHIVGLLKAGDILGVDCVMMQLAAHTASAVAMTDTAGYFIPRAAFLKAVAADPMLNIRLMRSVCEQISRIEKHSMAIKNKSLSSRLAEIFLMAGEAPRRTPVEMDFKADEFDYYLHTSGALVKETLQEFKRKKIISQHANAIVINEPDLLQQM